MIDDPAARAGALNMAIDETLLFTASRPLLHFYRWSEPSVSFGYFSRLSEAQAFAGRRALVRRWTGGGVVPHGDDLTYSLIIPSSDPAHAFSSREIYRRVHSVISRALSKSGVRAALAREDAPKTSDSCFANPVIADVMKAGRKIAGAAQRKTRSGLLQQGSIQWRGLNEAFRETFARELGASVTRQNMDADVLEQAAQLAAAKYETEAWLRRR